MHAAILGNWLRDATKNYSCLWRAKRANLLMNPQRLQNVITQHLHFHTWNVTFFSMLKFWHIEVAQFFIWVPLLVLNSKKIQTEFWTWKTFFNYINQWIKIINRIFCFNFLHTLKFFFCFVFSFGVGTLIYRVSPMCALNFLCLFFEKSQKDIIFCQEIKKKSLAVLLIKFFLNDGKSVGFATRKLKAGVINGPKSSMAVYIFVCLHSAVLNIHVWSCFIQKL